MTTISNKDMPSTNVQHSSPWLILLVVLATTVAVPLNQFKVPPVLPLLMDAFSLSAARAGLLMSVFVVTGVVLAIPAGFIYQKLGYRLTGFVALVSIIIGSAMGALSENAGTMIFSRLIEGTGMILMNVTAPAIISLWFVSAMRGKAMGIWAIWFPLGQMVMFFVAPSIASIGGWRSLWWCGCFYAVVVGFLFYFLVKPVTGRDGPPPLMSLSKSHVKQVLGNGQLWLMTLLFCCFNFVFLSFRTWMPTFFQQVERDVPCLCFFSDGFDVGLLNCFLSAFRLGFR